MLTNEHKAKGNDAGYRSWHPNHDLDNRQTRTDDLPMTKDDERKAINDAYLAALARKFDVADSTATGDVVGNGLEKATVRFAEGLRITRQVRDALLKAIEEA